MFFSRWMRKWRRKRQVKFLLDWLRPYLCLEINLRKGLVFTSNGTLQYCKFCRRLIRGVAVLIPSSCVAQDGTEVVPETLGTTPAGFTVTYDKYHGGCAIFALMDNEALFTNTENVSEGTKEGESDYVQNV